MLHITFMYICPENIMRIRDHQASPTDWQFTRLLPCAKMWMTTNLLIHKAAELLTTTTNQ